MVYNGSYNESRITICYYWYALKTAAHCSLREESASPPASPHPHQVSLSHQSWGYSVHTSACAQFRQRSTGPWGDPGPARDPVRARKSSQDIPAVERWALGNLCLTEPPLLLCVFLVIRRNLQWKIQIRKFNIMLPITVSWQYTLWFMTNKVKHINIESVHIQFRIGQKLLQEQSFPVVFVHHHASFFISL